MIPLKDNLACKGASVVTFLLIALNVVAFGIESLVPAAQMQEFLTNWAMVPNRITEAFAAGDLVALGMACLTILTSMFLHGGIGHIVGNMIFLQAFGKAVENRLGPWRYLGFYLLGGLAAWGFHFATDPTSLVPALGASGAIAGVMGGYLLFYPKAKFRTLFITPLPIMADVRAYWLCLVWFASQVIPGISELLNPASGGGIAYWAHIGGFIGGLALAALYAWRNPQTDACYAEIPCECNTTCTKHRVRDQLRRFFVRDDSTTINKSLTTSDAINGCTNPDFCADKGCSGQCGGNCGGNCNGGGCNK